MFITIAEKSYKLPGSLRDVTIWDRILFDREHGKELKEQLKKLIDMKEGPMKELEFSDYHYQLACRNISFLGKIPWEVIVDTDLAQVLSLYHHTTRSFTEDVDFGNQEFELNRTFFWENDEWQIQAPELRPDSEMSLGEFLQAKQWVKNTWELAEEKWDALHGLACVYFRKAGEKFNEDFTNEGSERYELMKRLPLEYAIHLGFFFRDSILSYLQILHFSNQTTDPGLARQN
jgi:hypothetical protein